MADLRPSLAYGVLSARTGKTAKPACARRNAFSATEIVAFSETVMIGPSQWHRQTIYPIALPFAYAVHSSLNISVPVTRIERVPPKESDFESDVSAYSTKRA